MTSSRSGVREPMRTIAMGRPKRVGNLQRILAGADIEVALMFRVFLAGQGSARILQVNDPDHKLAAQRHLHLFPGDFHLDRELSFRTGWRVEPVDHFNAGEQFLPLVERDVGGFEPVHVTHQQAGLQRSWLGRLEHAVPGQRQLDPVGSMDLHGLEVARQWPATHQLSLADGAGRHVGTLEIVMRSLLAQRPGTSGQADQKQDGPLNATGPRPSEGPCQAGVPDPNMIMTIVCHWS